MRRVAGAPQPKRTHVTDARWARRQYSGSGGRRELETIVSVRMGIFFSVNRATDRDATMCLSTEEPNPSAALTDGDVEADVATKETLCCGVLEKDDEDPDFGCLLGPALLSVLIVVCGTASTITSKLMYETRSHGVDGCVRHDDDDADDDEKWHNCKFTKPWFQTLVMKLAMSVALGCTQCSVGAGRSVFSFPSLPSGTASATRRSPPS